MEEARSAFSGQDFVLVTAAVQTAGKGTRGRVWQSPRGNVHMTVAIHRKRLPPHRLALLPLEIGILLWEESASRIPLEARKALSLKWPNDLLLHGRKAAGVLMESHGDALLCGIGINVAEAPPVADGGSETACLSEAGLSPADAPALADGIYRRVVAAFSIPAAEAPERESILLAWQSRCDWTRRHRLRDRAGQPWVEPVSLNADGHLLVRHGDGSTEWLVSDYLI
jgi:BirA family biotin operon repressor/biotin-[acetyl-CoA-carboxylase] ligase